MILPQNGHPHILESHLSCNEGSVCVCVCYCCVQLEKRIPVCRFVPKENACSCSAGLFSLKCCAASRLFLIMHLRAALDGLLGTRLKTQDGVHDLVLVNTFLSYSQAMEACIHGFISLLKCVISLSLKNMFSTD